MAVKNRKGRPALGDPFHLKKQINEPVNACFDTARIGVHASEKTGPEIGILYNNIHPHTRAEYRPISPPKTPCLPVPFHGRSHV